MPESVIIGAPAGAPAPETPPAPAPEKVTIAGVEITLAPEAAKAVRDELARQASALTEAQGQARELSTALGSLKPPAAAPPPAAPVPPATNKLGIDVSQYERELFADPAKTLNLLIDNIHDAITERVGGSLRGEYRADQAEQRFWQHFYETHDDLRGDDFIVRAVVARDWGTLASLQPEKAAEKIAEAVRKELLRVAQKGGPKPPAAPVPPTEVPTGPGAGNPALQPSAPVVTLSTVLRKKQQTKYGLGA